MDKKVFNKTYFISAAIMAVVFLAIAYGCLYAYMSKDSRLIQDTVSRVSDALVEDFSNVDKIDDTLDVMGKVSGLNEIDDLYVSVNVNDGTIYGLEYDGEISDKKNIFGAVEVAHASRTFTSEFFEGECEVNCVMANSFYGMFSRSPVSLVIPVLMIIGAAFGMAIIPANINARRAFNNRNKKRK